MSEHYTNETLESYAPYEAILDVVRERLGHAAADAFYDSGEKLPPAERSELFGALARAVLPPEHPWIALTNDDVIVELSTRPKAIEETIVTPEIQTNLEAHLNGEVERSGEGSRNDAILEIVSSCQNLPGVATSIAKNVTHINEAPYGKRRTAREEAAHEFLNTIDANYRKVANIGVERFVKNARKGWDLQTKSVKNLSSEELEELRIAKELVIAHQSILQLSIPMINSYLANKCYIQDSPDLVQEIAVAFHSKIGTYKNQGASIFRFMYGIAAHKVTDYYRRKSKQQDREQPFDVLLPSIEAAPVANWDVYHLSSLAEQDAQTDFQKITRSTPMSDLQLATICLRNGFNPTEIKDLDFEKLNISPSDLVKVVNAMPREGYEQSEIADIFDTSTGAVRVMAHRARAALQKNTGLLDQSY